MLNSLSFSRGLKVSAAMLLLLGACLGPTACASSTEEDGSADEQPDDEEVGTTQDPLCIISIGGGLVCTPDKNPANPKGGYATAKCKCSDGSVQTINMPKNNGDHATCTQYVKAACKRCFDKTKKPGAGQGCQTKAKLLP